MKRLIIICALISSISFIVSCKKKKKDEITEDETPQPIANNFPDYNPHKAGNYWIYERFEIDEDGNSKSLHEFDSSYVEKDTVINNKTYTKIRRQDFLFKQFNYLLQRDSLHYIIGPSGGVIFSSEDFTTVFNRFSNVDQSGDTIYKVSVKMADRDFEVSAPAGKFLTSAMKSTIFTFPAYASPNVPNPRNMYTRFAKNIGVITETEVPFLGSPLLRERRLIRYHVN